MSPGGEQKLLPRWGWNASASTRLEKTPLVWIGPGKYRVTRATLRARGSFRIDRAPAGALKLGTWKGTVLVTYVYERKRGRGSNTVKRRVRVANSGSADLGLELVVDPAVRRTRGGTIDWTTSVKSSPFAGSRKGEDARIRTVDGAKTSPDLVQWRVCGSGIDFVAGQLRTKVSAAVTGR